MNAVKIKHFTGRKKQSGATLVVIIITMLVVAVVGIVLYSITDTSTMNQSVAQGAAKAFYLAESGIRIAASEYKAATAATKDATMIALHLKTFTMPDNVSTIEIEIYPYWLYATTADVTNSTSTTLYLHLPGGVPPIDDTGTTAITFPTSGLLKIEDARAGRPSAWVGDTTTTTVASYTNLTNANVGSFNAASGGTPVTFTLSSSFPDAANQIYAGDEFYIGNCSYTSTQPASQGGDLILALDPADTNDYTAKIFPPQQGTIFVVSAVTKAVSQYSYDLRDTTTPHTVRLTNIQPINGVLPLPDFPLSAVSGTVLTGTQIYVGKSVGFRSASTYGQ